MSWTPVHHQHGNPPCLSLWDPSFPRFHVFLIFYSLVVLVEHDFQYFPEKGCIGGKFFISVLTIDRQFGWI